MLAAPRCTFIIFISQGYVKTHVLRNRNQRRRMPAMTHRLKIYASFTSQPRADAPSTAASLSFNSEISNFTSLKMPKTLL